MQKLPHDLFSYMRLAHTYNEEGAREAAEFQDSVMGTHAELTAVEHLTNHLEQRLARYLWFIWVNVHHCVRWHVHLPLGAGQCSETIQGLLEQ